MLHPIKFNLKQMVIFVCLCSLAAALAIQFMDKPLTIYMHSSGLDQFLLLRNITEGLLMPLTILTLLIALGRNFKQHKLGSIVYALYFYLALKLTLELKTGLKIIFGRYWPTTWTKHNLSLIHDGIYGFNWGHGFANQGSFPSGHSCYTFFCCTWLYLLLPRLWYLWLACAILIPSCLIILNYHFLGDCVAGAGLGFFCAILSMWLWQRGQQYLCDRQTRQLGV